MITYSNISKGKTQAMLLQAIPYLQKGEVVGIYGCTDPDQIISFFKTHGLTVKAQPMMEVLSSQPIWDYNHNRGFFVSGTKPSEKAQTGYMFSLDIQEEHTSEEHPLSEEITKCKNSPYYFATNYLKITEDGISQPFTTTLSEDEFNKAIKMAV